MLSWQSSRFRSTFKIISIIVIEIIFIVFSLPLPISELNHRSFIGNREGLRQLEPSLCREAPDFSSFLVPPLRSLNSLTARKSIRAVQADMSLKATAAYIASKIRWYQENSNKTVYQIREMVSKELEELNEARKSQGKTFIPILTWSESKPEQFTFTVSFRDGEAERHISLELGSDELGNAVVNRVDVPLKQAEQEPIKKARADKTESPSAAPSRYKVTPSILTEKGKILQYEFEGGGTDDFEGENGSLSNLRKVVELEEGVTVVIQTDTVSSYAMNSLARSRKVEDDPRIGKPRLFVIREQPKVNEEELKLLMAALADDIVNAYFFGVGGLARVTIVTTRKMERFISQQLEYAFAGISDKEIRRLAPLSASFIIAQRNGFTKFRIEDMVQFSILDEDGKAKNVPVSVKKDGKLTEYKIESIEAGEDGILSITTAKGKAPYKADLNNLPRVRVTGYRKDIPSFPSERKPGTGISLGDGSPAAGRPTTGFYVSLVPGKYAAITDTGFGTYENFRRLKEAGAIPATEKLIIFISHGHLDHIGDLLLFLLNEDVTVVSSPVVMEQLNKYFGGHLEDVMKAGFNEMANYARRLVVFEDKGFDKPSYKYLSEIVDGYDLDSIGYNVELAALITRQPPYNWMYRFRQVDKGREVFKSGFKIGFTGDMKYDKALDEKHQGEFGEDLAGATDKHREAFLEFIRGLDVLIVEFGGAEVIHNTTDNIRDLIRDIKARNKEESGLETCPKLGGFHSNRYEGVEGFAEENDITLMKPGVIVTPIEGKSHTIGVDILKFFNAIRAMFKNDEEGMNEFLGEIEKYASVRYFSEDTEIISEGEPGSELFFLVNGTAEVKTGEKSVARLKAGNIIGENIILGKNANATVIAKKGSAAFVLDKTSFELMKPDIKAKLKSSLKRIGETRVSINRFAEAVNGGKSNLLTGIGQAVIEALALVVEVIEYTPEQGGKVIVEKGEGLNEGIFANSLAIIAKGSVDVDVAGEMVEVKEGQLILEMAVAEGEGAKRNATVKVGKKGVTLYRLKLSDLDFIKEFYPALYWFIFNKAAQTAKQRRATITGAYETAISSYPLLARFGLKKLMEANPDVFFNFEDIEGEIQKLIDNDKAFAVTMFDGDAIKKRNEALGKPIVDVMIFEMAEAFLEIAQELGVSPNKINMKVFRRGGDEFGFLTEVEGLSDTHLKIIHELVRINLPSRIESKYGIFMIDAAGFKDREKDLIDLLNASIEKGVIREFDKVGEKYVVKFNKDKMKTGDVDLLKEIMGKDLHTVDAREDWFALTSSIGVLYVDENMRQAIKKANRPLNSDTLMAGANAALSKAKEESLAPKEYQRKKGNRIHMITYSDDLDVDSWFHERLSILSPGRNLPTIFFNQNDQFKIEDNFKKEGLRGEDEYTQPDNVVPIVHSFESMKRIMDKDQRPDDRLIAFDILWGDKDTWKDMLGRFGEAVERERAAGRVHKGRSYLLNFYKFGMLNSELGLKMFDADWAIKVFGYIVNEQVRKKFGDNFELVIARAPPGASPDRFYVRVRLSEPGTVAINPDELDDYLRKELPALLQAIREQIAHDTHFCNSNSFTSLKSASLQATVIPIQQGAGKTFAIMDRLSPVPVEYPKDQMDEDVAGEFSEDARLRPDDKDVIITDDGHRIVFYNKESGQQKLAMKKFEEDKRRNALKSLIDSLSVTKEDYSRTLRRLYREVRDMKADSDEAIEAIPDDKSISEASRLIINEIKQKLLVNLVADNLGEYKALMGKVSSVSPTEQTIAMSLDAITYEEGPVLFDAIYAIREAMGLGAKIVLVSFGEDVDVKEFLKAQGIPSHLLEEIEIMGRAEFFEKYGDNTNLTVLISNSEYDLKGAEKRMPYKILKTRQLEENNVPSLLRALSSIMAIEGASGDITIPIYTSLEAAKTIRERL